MTTAIIGVGIMGTMSLFAACSRQNGTASEMTAAMMLAANVQEGMANLSFSDPILGKSVFGPESGETLPNFDDVDDFDGQTISPPIDSMRTAIPELSQYSQVIGIDPVDPNSLSLTLPKTVTNRSAVRIKVRVLYTPFVGAGSQEVYSTAWVRTER